MITVLDVIFIAISGIALIFGINRRMNFGIAAFLSAYLVLGLVGHSVWRLSTNAEYGVEDYLVAHVISFVFFAGCIILTGSEPKRNSAFLYSVSRIGSAPLVLSLSVWMFFQAYLLVRYGFSGAVRLGQDSNQTELPYFEVVLATLTNVAAMGAALAVVIKTGMDRRYVRNLFVVALFVMFVMYLLAFGAAIAGGRRTVFILAVCFLLSKVLSARTSLMSLVRNKILQIAVAASVCLLLSAYYQQIRNNVYSPEVQLNLGSPDFFSKLEGVRLLLTPSSDRDPRTVATVNRGGPFDFLVSIVEARHQFGRSSDGALFLHEIMRAVPKILYPDKPDYDVDILIGQIFSVPPHRDWAVGPRFFDNPDYSTSVLALLFGDFGWIGVALSIPLLVLSMRFSVSVVGYWAGSIVVTVGGLGVVFALAGLVEGSLATLLASFRILLGVVGVGWLLLMFGRTFMWSRRSDSRRSPML